MAGQDSIVHYLTTKRSESSKGFYSIKRLSQYPPGPGEVALPVSIIHRDEKVEEERHNQFLRSLLLLGRGIGHEHYNLPVHPQVASLIWFDKNFTVFKKFERHLGNCSVSELFSVDANQQYVFHDKMKNIMKKLIGLTDYLKKQKIHLSVFEHLPLSDITFSVNFPHEPQLISFGCTYVQSKAKGRLGDRNYACLSNIVKDLMKKFNLDIRSTSPSLVSILTMLTERNARDVKYLQNHPAFWKAGSSCMFVSFFKLHMLRFAEDTNFNWARAMLRRLAMCYANHTSMLRGSWTTFSNPGQDLQIKTVSDFYDLVGDEYISVAYGLLSFQIKFFCHYNENYPNNWVDDTELEACLEKAFPSTILELYKISGAEDFILECEILGFEEQRTLPFSGD